MPERYAAVLARDRTATFFYGVITTGIFCRPSCPAKRAKQEHIQFFDSSHQAQAAGYRACQRCRPLDNPEKRVEEIKALLHDDPSLTLAQLARHLQLSPAHVQKQFKAHTGISPKTYSREYKMQQLKNTLPYSSVTVAAYQAGYLSQSSMYRSAHLGMTPKQYQHGGKHMHLHYHCFDTLLGEVFAARSSRGVCVLRFETLPEGVAHLKTELPEATLQHNPEAFADVMAQVRGYLQGEQQAFELALDTDRATPFQQAVWQTLQTIPYGATFSYSEVAANMGKPTANRAVANACGQNRLALLIPCHRVLRSGGQISGYRWGVERKAKLLDLERRAANTKLI